MNTFNQNSEHNLRNRMNSHEFDFDPSAWDDMEQLLDKKKPRGGAAWYFSFPFLAIGIATLTLAVCLSTFSNNSGQNNITTNTNNTVQSTTVENANSTNTTTTSNTTTSNVLIENSTLVTDETNTTNTSNRKTTSSTNATASSIIEKASGIINEATTTPTKNISKETVPLTPFLNEQLPKSSPVIRKAIPLIIEDEAEEMKVTPTSPATAPVIRFNEKTQEFELLETKNIPLLEIEEKEEEIDVRKEIAQRKFDAGLLVGTGYTTSANGPIDRGTISPTIGAFVNYDINDKLSLQVEALVKPFFTSTSLLSNPSANENLFDTTIVNLPQEYNYVNKELKTVIELPVTIKYNVNKRNAIFAGIRPTLIRTKQKIVDAFSSNLDSRNSISTRDDIAVTLGIERQLTKKVSMDVRYSQGLIDQDKDDDKKNLNSDIFLALKYAF